ncbi:flavin reductase family protein [Segnochrobactrum spirostomi]|uniref:Flavin reductase family protein n=1 Tax=Segnochrobactrum spirostomi TaxID=2608987 RepID=A0A6A7Y702_9HYPH|nr:flavin reductase family protein [Segnochrobactrum spirostomi]MQT14485.1 flavin reductase family protein [Segnochrobactrum spirostomi]
MVEVPFLHGMRRVGGAVAVVTTKAPGGEPKGLTATAFASLSADPPSLLVCVNRRTQLAAEVEAAGRFCVNVLSHAHIPVAETFAGRAGLAGGERFAEGAWGALETGAPVLADAYVVFDCVLERVVEHTSHLVLFGAVARTAITEAAGAPLLYCEGRFATLAEPEPERRVPA